MIMESNPQALDRMSGGRTRPLSRLRRVYGGAPAVDRFDAREGDGKFSASQPLEIRQNRKGISEASPRPEEPLLLLLRPTRADADFSPLSPDRRARGDRI